MVQKSIIPLGDRILFEIPNEEKLESGIILMPNIKKDKDDKIAKKQEAYGIVVAVSDECKLRKYLNEGDKILVEGRVSEVTSGTKTYLLTDSYNVLAIMKEVEEVILVQNL